MSLDRHSKGRPALEGAELRRAIKAVMEKFLDLDHYEIFIFGSEATGAGSSRSDIDVGVLGPQAVSNVMIQKIRAELESLRTLRPFDLVDFNRADESFKTAALQHVERL